MNGTRSVRAAERGLFWLSVAAILYLCLYPGQFDFDRPLNLSYPEWSEIKTRIEWVDCVANFLFFLPFGVFGALSYGGGRKWRLGAVVVVAALLSVGVESMQSFLPTRVSSMRDVLLNTVGAAAGVGLAGWMRCSGAGPSWMTGWLPRDGFGWVLLGLWVMWQAFPFIPSLRLYRFYEAVESVRHPTFAWLKAGDVFFAFLLIPAACGSRMGLPVLASMVLWAQFVLPEQRLGLDRILAAGLGLVVSQWVGARVAERDAVRGLAYSLVLWLALRATYPFDFSGEAQPFHWWPFTGLAVDSRGALARIMAGKLFLYAGTIWALCEARWSWGAATVGVMALLGSIECAQVYLPVHQAESTDPALALLGALLVGALRLRR